ncbi:MAG: endonuclease/exonuclease/phosphatase family protein [Pirellulales bacterium]
MAKKSRAKSSSRSSKSAWIWSLVFTALTGTGGAGVGGWFKPDMPLAGPAVQQVLALVRGKVREEVSHVTGIPEDKLPTISLGPPQGAAGGSSATGQVAVRPATATSTISIASFNIQVFGTTKLAKPEVAERLAGVVRRFDVVAIQEVRSKDDSVLPQFLQRINAQGAAYNFVLGPRLGRTSSKEQYAIIYNTATIELDAPSVATFPDPNDLLHREPLAAHFHVRGVPNPFSFWLVDIHTDPDEVRGEVDALADVFLAMQNTASGEDDVILLGDLNASPRQLGRLGKLPGMTYAIGDNVPTNTRGDKTYDNLLFDGRRTVEYTGQWGVFNLQREFSISLDQALELSDHNPVWALFGSQEGAPETPLAARPTSPR